MNVEAALVAYLSRELGVPAYGDVPDPRPGEFVTVERTGGATERFRDLPQVAVQFWAPSRHEASELCRRGVAALAAFEGEDGVCRVDVTTSYDFPDPDSRQARYQAACELVTA